MGAVKHLKSFHFVGINSEDLFSKLNIIGVFPPNLALDEVSALILDNDVKN